MISRFNECTLSQGIYGLYFWSEEWSGLDIKSSVFNTSNDNSVNFSLFSFQGKIGIINNYFSVVF